MDFYLHTNDQISLYRFQAFHCDAIMGQMLYQFQGNQRDYFSNDTFRGRSLVSSAVYYEVTPPDTFPLRHNFGGVTQEMSLFRLESSHSLPISSSLITKSRFLDPPFILGKDLFFILPARALIEFTRRNDSPWIYDSFPPENYDPVNLLLEEFVDELALITFPPGNDDLPFDIESDLREIEYLLNHDPTKEMDSILEDSVDEGNLADPNNDLVDTIPKMFTDEHTLDYSSPPLYDDVDDDLVELESDNDNVYDDPFDSKEDKIKESKLLIDELDPPRSSDFLPSPKFTIRVTPDKNVKKLSSSNASLILEDFNPPLYELPFHKEVPGSETLLSFSSENEEKVFNPGILTSKGVHTSLLPELSHRGPKAFKVITVFESPMEIFPCFYGEDIRVLCLHFYPP
ncbi:hypothetical protein Tco_1066892 [Tanacetum coccineum]|uniref:Reverse transcriptase domain-containing protein n=1 Tax=Tanacetum coccineum TaxID=301880 RepID=A0ABQ5HBA9_9ASTR